MRTTFTTMGTTASLVVPSADLVGVVESIFTSYDERFSLYRSDSELSKVASGELSLMEASEALRTTYATALEWRDATEGAFTPNRPDGVVDLNGVVKGLAIADAGAALTAAGANDWSINVGGDVLVSGAETDGSPWTIGVIDPADLTAILCAVVLNEPRRAIASSGSAERGDHIWRGRSGDVPEFVQVTVVADDIVTADVLATAIVAGGGATLDFVAARFGVDVLTVNAAGEMRATPGFRDALAG